MSIDRPVGKVARLPVKQSSPRPSAGAYDIDAEAEGRHSSMPWFRLFPSDWRSALQGLSLSHVAVYVHLTLLMLESEEPVREDHRRLARLLFSKVPTIEGAIDSLLSDRKITRVDGGLWSEIAEKEMRYRRQKSEKARRNVGQRGKKSQQKQQPDLTADHLSRSRSRSMDDLKDRPFAPTSAYEHEPVRKDARPSAASFDGYVVGQVVQSEEFGRVKITEVDGDAMNGVAESDGREMVILIEPEGLRFSADSWGFEDDIE
jgi:uncharacterized protein YdaU (DUF1376 family)